MKRARTIAELKKVGYKVFPVRAEIRKNLLGKLKKEEKVFRGIIGYDETVVPQLVNVLLAGHDIILLGERGQAKSRLIRTLTTFLDDEVPKIKGCEINDNPYDPICARCKRLIDECGDDVEIEWIGRDERFGEKLATPDTQVADLVGEIDPIKVAEGRLLSDPEVIHFGLIPRVNRGIFAINELPDLPERVQVALFNVMEERDVQIKGYKLRLPLDVLVVATANPEDYTSRGRIVTPLKDRFNALIRTHYPTNRAQEFEIALQESTVNMKTDGVRNEIPEFIGEIISELTMQARRSEEVSQHSGVSVRMTISNLEIIIASAQKRAILLSEKIAAPRISDLWYVQATSSGKIELEALGERSEQEIILRLLRRSIRIVFDEKIKLHELDELVDIFSEGFSFETSDMKPSFEYLKIYDIVSGLRELAGRLIEDGEPELLASALEFFLEGLYLHNRLSKDVLTGRFIYSGRIRRI